MLKCLNVKNGFTLIELLASVSIIAVLTLIFAMNYRGGDKQYALQLAANKLAQDIRSAQEMALAAAECAPCGNIIPSRYGIYVANTGADFYIIWADLNENDIPSYENGLYNYPSPTNGDQAIQTVFYGKGIVLNQLNWAGCAPRGPKFGHITFSPPDPVTELKIGKYKDSDNPSNPPVSCSEFTLTLSAGSDGPTKSIKVNKAGLIYVQ